MPSEAAYISLGANLGDRQQSLRRALERLSALGRLTAVSSLYATAPVDYFDQPEFYNAVARLECELEPRALLARMLAIELEQRRQRLLDKGPRTLDLDLLFFGARIVAEEGLELPHPRLHERRFVLEPLVEIAPELRHPRLALTAAELLAALPPVASDRVLRLDADAWPARVSQL